jgi:hypothetical protein
MNPHSLSVERNRTGVSHPPRDLLGDVLLSDGAGILLNCARSILAGGCRCYFIDETVDVVLVTYLRSDPAAVS